MSKANNNKMTSQADPRILRTQAVEWLDLLV